ncbi:MAG: hypothetical protein GY770_24160, partial [Aestuariibacter sp.]|nr:hypothetical protein [Aestuariibacter sp.]
STLIGTDAGNTWELEGVNSGTLNTDTTFSLFANLKGGAGSDTFDFTKGGSVTGSVVGNGTGVTNTVIAADIANEWNITDNGVGTLHKDIDAGTQFEGAVVTQFSGIQNITGAGNTDIFVFGASGSISGKVDGKGGINTLMARDGVENTWAFTDLNSGSVTQVSGAVKYVNEFTNITKFIAGGSAEQADFSGMDAVSISASDYVGFTSFKGKENAGNTFTATEAVNTWVIDGVNDGTLNGTITFINFANLTGNAQADSFDFSQGGSITGTIDGVGDSNTIIGQNVASEWDINKANEGALYLDNSADGFGTAYVAKFTNIQNVTGGSESDSFVFTGAGALLDGELDGGAGTNTLIARDFANAWNIDNANQGVLYSGTSNSDFIASNQIASFKQIQNITGGSNSDIFIFGTSGSIVGTLDGGNGTN